MNIDAIMAELGIADYVITSRGVDVEGDVIIPGGYTSLQGGPREVCGYFSCAHTKITSLQGGPREVGGDFGCSYTNITSLQGGPRKVGGSFYCYGTKIKGKSDASELGGFFYLSLRKKTAELKIRRLQVQ